MTANTTTEVHDPDDYRDPFGPNSLLFAPSLAADHVGEIVAQRGNTHGDFGNTCATAQAIKNSLRRSQGWSDLSAYQQEALDAISLKMARIANGDPMFPDHWDDIQGYAKRTSQENASVESITKPFI